jgi:hypothetical protein
VFPRHDFHDFLESPFLIQVELLYKELMAEPILVGRWAFGGQSTGETRHVALELDQSLSRLRERFRVQNKAQLMVLGNGKGCGRRRAL